MWPTFPLPPLQVVPPPPGYSDNGCGYVAPFTPTNIPNLRVGDFMLWVCVTNVGRTWIKSAALLPPTGWQIFSSDVGRRNWNNSGCVIFYRWATSDDLNPATEYVAEFEDNPISSGNPYRVCSVTYAYRDIHPNMPFGSCSLGRASSSGDWNYVEPNFMHVGHDGAPILLVGGSRRADSAAGQWGLQSANALGPELSDEVRFSLDYEVNVGTNEFYTGRRTSTISEGENWIPGETPGASLQDSGWTATNTGTRAMSGYHSRLTATGAGAVRHYIEYEVSLTEGERYTFHLSRRGSWNTGYMGAVGVSYVDPSNNERGFISHNSVNIGGVLDPLTDYGTVWFRRNPAEREDGVPSTTGSTPVLMFTAQESGVHKLRISVVRAPWNGSSFDYYWEFAAAAGEYREIRGVCFRRGFTTAYFQPTPGGAVMAGDATNGAQASAWHPFDFGDPDVSCPGGVGNHLAVSLNNDTTLAPAVMECAWNQGDIVGLVDQFTVYPTHVTSDDLSAEACSSRPVMPRIDGTLKKYYFEVESLNTRHFNFGVSLGSFGGGARYSYSTRSGRATTPNADGATVAVATPTAPAIGDKWGCLINYVDKEIAFYKNGTLLGAVDMYDTYGTSDATNSGKTGWEWPCYAFVASFTGPWPFTLGHVKTNLTGPFSYQPSGTEAFDWVNN